MGIPLDYCLYSSVPDVGRGSKVGVSTAKKNGARLYAVMLVRTFNQIIPLPLTYST